jgi:hypothetical protein
VRERNRVSDAGFCGRMVREKIGIGGLLDLRQGWLVRVAGSGGGVCVVGWKRRRRWSKSSGEGGLSGWFSFGRGQGRVGGDGGTGRERGEEMKWSLVLGEQKNQRPPWGDGGFVSKQNESGGLRLLWLQEGERWLQTSGSSKG